MIEEALSGTSSQVQKPADLQTKAPAPTDRQASAKKMTGSANTVAGRSAGRNERLISHLLIGFMMTVIAIAGYTFLGPHTAVNAAEQAGSNIINVATDVPVDTVQGSALDYASFMTELATMQAEMDEITQQMNALKDGNLQFNTSSSPSANSVSNLPYYNGSSSNLDQALSTLDQMMQMTHEMIAKMNSLNQQGALNTPANSSGHGHH